MPRTVFEADGYRHQGLVWNFPRWPWLYARSWENPQWRPEPLPNIEPYLWSNAPWVEHDRSHTSIDHARTEALFDVDVRIGCEVGGMWQNVRTGTPYQLASQSSTTTVIEWGEHGYLATHQIPLPSPVHLIGDPTGFHTDRQWHGIDPENRVLWELSSVRRTGGVWYAHAVHRIRLDKPWTAIPGALSGGGTPIVAGLPRPEEFARGRIDHAMWLVLNNYSPERIVGCARKTDGTMPGHPLYAGDRLVLAEDWAPPPGVTLTRDESTVVAALKDHNRGVIVNDKTGGKGGGIRLPMDPRIHLDLEFRLSDFDVMTPDEETP